MVNSLDPGSPRGNQEIQVTVIGGGLAGMAAALRLAERGCRVSLYEKSHRLGGKAGADRGPHGFDDHGFHIFPLWYRNVWSLIHELGIEGRFIDATDFVQLQARRQPAEIGGKELELPYGSQFGAPEQDLNRLHNGPSREIKNVIRNIRSSPLPWYQTLLFFFSTVDLARHSFKQNKRLDQLSITGFLRSRWYATEAIARVYQDLMLKAISVPSYFVSAATTRQVIRYWLKYPVPMCRILDDDLQTAFIDKFRDRLAGLGVDIFTEHKLEHLNVQEARVTVARFRNEANGERVEVPLDRLVLAIPAFDLVGVWPPEAYAASPTLGDIRNLRSRPMAALNVYFESSIPNMPKAHVNLIDSKYGLTFIDVSQSWGKQQQRYRGSVLSVIMTDFSELEGVDQRDATAFILEELSRFVPDVRNVPILHTNLQKHLDAPLFMNDVGIYAYRPNPLPDEPRYRIELKNLYLAGDYCRTKIDLVSMEGAYTSGLMAAEALRRETPSLNETSPVRIERAQEVSTLWLWATWAVGIGPALLLAAWLKVVAWFRGGEPAVRIGPSRQVALDAHQTRK